MAEPKEGANPAPPADDVKVLSADEIERARLELDRKQLDIDKSKAELERSFFSRNTGILISAAVSFAALIVSTAQVWVTTISKDKELQISVLQHKADIESQEHQKERELTSSDAQHKRELDLSAARFITENRKQIFEGSPDDKELFAKVIPTLFPPEVAAPLLQRIEKASTGQSQKIWQEARQQSISGAQFSPDGRVFATSSGDAVRLWNAQTSNVVMSIPVAGFVSSVAFSPDGRQLLISMVDGSLERYDLGSGRLIQKTNPAR